MLQGAASNGQQWRELYGDPVPGADACHEPLILILICNTPSFFLCMELAGEGATIGVSKDWNQQLADPQRRKQFPCYVVAPQVEELWDGDDLKKIQALIAQLPSADMNRIYVLGHSMGGHGTYIFIQLASNYFAAAAPSAGSGLKRTEEFIDPVKIKDIPLWAFHGDQDRTCPFERDQRVDE